MEVVPGHNLLVVKAAAGEAQVSTVARSVCNQASCTSCDRSHSQDGTLNMQTWYASGSWDMLLICDDEIQRRIEQNQADPEALHNVGAFR